MPLASPLRRLRRAAQAFRTANQGNIAVLFGIVLVPLISFVGVAVDYSRAAAARSAMQAALDSTALMVSRDLSVGTIDVGNINTATQQYFKALYTYTDATVGTVTGTYTAATGTKGPTVTVASSGSVSTAFMKVVGFTTMGINSTSTTTWGNTRLRVALALDNTGSMDDDGKITALKTASKNLIDQLSNLAKTPGDVYVSIIPFSKDVNVGASNYSQSWIDWTDWEAEAPDLNTAAKKPSNWSTIGPGSSCPWSMNYDGFTCMNGATSTSTTSSIPSSGLICPGADRSSNSYKYHYLINGCYTSVAVAGSSVTVSSGYYASCSGQASTCTCTGSNSRKVCKQPSYTHVWTPNPRNTWSGCVADRTPDYDVSKDVPTPGVTASLFPAEQYYENRESYCVSGNNPPLQPITPLSYDFSGLKTAIDAMQPTGGTNQPIGLAWAWNSLSQATPAKAPVEDTKFTYKKVIILLSDGLNTENRWPSFGSGSKQNGTMIDDRQKLMCDNIKKEGYTIYTIHVNTGKPADPSSAVLKYCASTADKFFMLTSANQMVSTFNQIGTELTDLRVAY